MTKHLKGKGEADYDEVHDILFFKTKEREYDRSIELYNLVVDIDTEGFLTGIQIFEASKFLKIPKTALRKIPRWEFCANANKDIIEVRLKFQAISRNKLIEKNPIIVESISEELPNSEMICVTA